MSENEQLTGDGGSVLEVALLLETDAGAPPSYVGVLEAAGLKVRLASAADVRGAMGSPGPAMVLVDVADAARCVAELRDAGARQPLVVLARALDDEGCLAAVAAGAEDCIDSETVVGGGALVRRLELVYARWQKRNASNELAVRLMQVDKLSSIDRLSASIAHGINNPAAVILANSSVVAEMLDDLGAAFDELSVVAGERGQRLLRCYDIANVLGELRVMNGDNAASVDRIRECVDDVKALSPPPVEERAAIDINEVVRLAVHLARNELRYRARVELDLGRIPRVVGFRGRLFQALLNVLVNAGQAIESAESREGLIAIRTDVDGDDVVISVADSGPGIEPRVRDRIFVPFFTTRAPDQGLGLGLSATADIVRQHNGRISVQSSPGAGSTFEIRLPHAARTATELRQRPGKTAPQPRCRILLIDDEALMRSSYRRLLRSMGHEVVEAPGGLAGLEVLEQDRDFDVILCDVMMPDLDGALVYERLLTRAPELCERIIFVSGGPVTDRTMDFVAGTRSPVLEKPLWRADLAAAIAELTESARPHEATAESASNRAAPHHGVGGPEAAGPRGPGVRPRNSSAPEATARSTSPLSPG